MTTKKERSWNKIWTGIVVGLVVGVGVTSLGAFYSWQQALAAERRASDKKLAEVRATYEARYKTAGETYVNSLGQLVTKGGDIASSSEQSEENLEVAGRSIVSLRNELSQRLTGLASALDHEIDDLQGHIQQLQKNPKNKDLQEQVRKDLLVLKEKWPAKTDSIKIEIRKLLAELGIEHTNDVG